MNHRQKGYNLIANSLKPTSFKENLNVLFQVIK